MTASRASRSPWTPILVVLALIGLLVSVFAMQSMTMRSHADTGSGDPHAYGASTTSAPAASTGTGVSIAPMPASHVMPANETGAMPAAPCDEHCVMGCVVMAAVCGIVFTLGSLLLLLRLPAASALAMRLLPRASRPQPRARAHIYSPSLTVLSISRI
ncbi:hypothetical protein [Clavibacter phaseoli]|uniref:hypothetical protein n=1 Tax=Clavibacter phaseoli TaxID=1734031 RepID=UPI001F30F5A0|nr:hypothetical protein [Clavibacter phaseoli]UKF32442.1 hypothetical protein FGD69_14985 [Clavibacter phaseoli]UKF38537.1 hypothetical protein FGI33_15365 [Clavibacter phaseoli]